jgi:hypothetical protein
MTKKIKQIKLPVELADLAEVIAQPAPNWKLVRERDGLTKHAVGITWIEFGENGFYKDRHDEPAVGRSLLMSPFNQFFTWQTTDVTEIVEQRDDYIKFKTKNSNYELFKLDNEQDTNS